MAKEHIKNRITERKITEKNYFYASTHPYFAYEDDKFVPFSKESLDNVISLTFEFDSIIGQGKPVVFVASHANFSEFYHHIETGKINVKEGNLSDICDKYFDPEHWHFAEYDLERGYTVAVNSRDLTDDELIDFLNDNKISKYNMFVKMGYCYDYKHKVAISNDNISENYEKVMKFATSALITQTNLINFHNGGISNVTENEYRKRIENEEGESEKISICYKKSTVTAIREDVGKTKFDAKLCASLALGDIDERAGEDLFGNCTRFELKIIQKWKKKILKAAICGGSNTHFKEKNGERITMRILNYFLDRGFDILMVKNSPTVYQIHITWAVPIREDGSIIKGDYDYIDSTGIKDNKSKEGGNDDV